jgi:hypothetical protein
MAHSPDYERTMEEADEGWEGRHAMAQLVREMAAISGVSWRICQLVGEMRGHLVS